tara:strand:- start:3537 stop:3773 length:237 start_codon:yes stop_codon:yes gene_type:complete
MNTTKLLVGAAILPLLLSLPDNTSAQEGEPSSDSIQRCEAARGQGGGIIVPIQASCEELASKSMSPKEKPKKVEVVEE